MKNLLLILLACSVSVVSLAQKKKSEKEPAKAPVTQQPASKPEEKPVQPEAASPAQGQQQETGGFYRHFINKYLVANRFGDYDVAKDALYDILVENPENDSLVMTLAVLYFDNQKFTSAALVGQEMLVRNPKDPTALELTGSAFESLGLKDRALQYFESFYLVTNEFPALYKMAFLQYELKRFKESQANCDIMLTKKEADEIKVTFATADKKNKDYPIRVSVLNLLGMIARESGDNAAAKKYFEQALTVAPDFVQAKENLMALPKSK